jgi:RNA polymerase sigma-70 factor (ECF subfamily)
MYQIALNLCRDQVRRRQRWRLLIAEGAELPERPRGPLASEPLGQDPAEAATRREKREAVLQALDRIPAEQREVLILKEFEGMKFREIAQILGCPESTVKSRMYYGLNGVRTALQLLGIREP